MDPELKKAIFNVIPVATGVLVTGLVGSGLGFWWNLQLKKRERDLATTNAFYELYGELLAIQKLWNAYLKDFDKTECPDATRWALFERACSAEGKMEAVLIDLSSKYRSNADALEKLGQFRQVYQQLRETIRNNKPLVFGSAKHPVYLQLKSLAPLIASMAREPGHAPDRSQADAWIRVTDNRHEEFWDEG